MGLINDAGSILFQVIKMKEAYDANKDWERRRKEAFFKYIEKYLDKDRALDVDNLMSGDTLDGCHIQQPMKNSRFAVYNSSKEPNASKYEVAVTIMNCKNEIEELSLQTIYANSDIEARNKVSQLIRSEFLNTNKKNFAYAHIGNINRFFNKLKINNIETSKYLEILYRKESDELLGFYVKDENGLGINFNYFEMEE